ncbi:acyl-CoA N-acyltransferase [Cantharellus anzutake]|uniref:acyl-CoA N-acyltransferase n=1 Tax=Cantharellus anzutake TaxID=1750568 RepID=UPI001903DB6A|nr:acyl-CoA N-acyltransferase [Cantharellus anzutake]KAF8342553.1 acyl-CoA N-acyltransferase [Cantharellus anzutake]
MNNVPWHIRAAAPEDVGAIIKLIVDLAIYEKAADRVKVTPELLQKNLFEHKYAHALLAYAGPEGSPDAQPVGFALYFFNFSTWTGKPGLYLEDLYVIPEHRGTGIGKALFGHLGKIAIEKDCGRVDWQVLDWNQPSIDFYEKGLEAKMLKEWRSMRLEGDEIQRLLKFLAS